MYLPKVSLHIINLFNTKRNPLLQLIVNMIYLETVRFFGLGTQKHFLKFIFSENDRSRIIIFVTRANILKFFDCTRWFLDGIFKTEPKLFCNLNIKKGVHQLCALAFVPTDIHTFVDA